MGEEINESCYPSWRYGHAACGGNRQSAQAHGGNRRQAHLVAYYEDLFSARFERLHYLLLVQGLKQYTLAQKTKTIRLWLQDIKDILEIHFLLKYAPKLNAAEYIWKEPRKWASHNRFFGTLKDLKASLFRRFNRFQGNRASRKTVVPYFA
jgi:hypothetical protein